MNIWIYFCCFLPLIIVFIQQERDKHILARNAVRKRKGKNMAMTEMLNSYVGKDCIIYMVGMGNQVSGVVKEVRDGWLLLDNGKDVESLNLDYIVRVRCYPRNKKGKRAAIVTD